MAFCLKNELNESKKDKIFARCESSISYGNMQSPWDTSLKRKLGLLWNTRAVFLEPLQTMHYLFYLSCFICFTNICIKFWNSPLKKQTVVIGHYKKPNPNIMGHFYGETFPETPQIFDTLKHTSRASSSHPSGCLKLIFLANNASSLRAVRSKTAVAGHFHHSFVSAWLTASYFSLILAKSV